MEKDWKIKFYKDDKGKCQVEDFLNSLSEKDKKKIEARIKLLEEQGIFLHRPHSDYLRDGIRELRVKLERGGTRILYFFCFETYIIFTNAFYKRSDEVPENEINKALDCKQDILSKYNENNIKDL